MVIYMPKYLIPSRLLVKLLNDRFIDSFRVRRHASGIELCGVDGEV